jgi:hypothetical protein
MFGGNLEVAVAQGQNEIARAAQATERRAVASNILRLSDAFPLKCCHNTDDRAQATKIFE